MRDKEHYETTKRLYEAQGNLNFNIDVFGDEIARREGYLKHYGIDAIHFYLINKYKWTPATVRQMSFDDLEFLLREEMNGWTLPKGLRKL